MESMLIELNFAGRKWMANRLFVMCLAAGVTAALGCVDATNEVVESNNLTSLAQPVGTAPTSLKACVSNAPCTMPLIATSEYHTAVVRSDGTVWAWGANSEGELGNGKWGETQLEREPVQVLTYEGVPLSGVIEVTTGLAHTVALKEDGTVWAWGRPAWLGIGPWPETIPDGCVYEAHNWGRSACPLAVQVMDSSGEVFSEVKAVAAGKFHTLAVKSDGTVWAWGDNTYGQLGNNTSSNRDLPIKIMDSAIAVAAGPSHSVAIKSDGTVWAWGKNPLIGDGTGNNSREPVQVMVSAAEPLSDVISIAAGEDHTLALKQDGTVWGWGNDWRSQLAGWSADYYVSTERCSSCSLWAVPLMASDDEPLSGVTAIATRENHSFAIKSDGTLWKWGYHSSSYDCLDGTGDGTSSGGKQYCLKYPVQVFANSIFAEFAGVAAVGAGGDNHIVVIKADGTIWVWGYNQYGQLGDGTTGDRYVPKKLNITYQADACASLPSCSAGDCVSLECSGRGSCGAGSCACESGFVGPACQFSNAATCSGHGQAKADGSCACSAGFGGASCNQCTEGFSGYPNCASETSCNAATTCSGHGTCNTDGSCACSGGFGGANCDRCADGFSGYPNCVSETPCDAATTCNGHGTCNANGSCGCYERFGGANCDRCANGYANYPTCELTSKAGDSGCSATKVRNPSFAWMVIPLSLGLLAVRRRRRTA